MHVDLAFGFFVLRVFRFFLMVKWVCDKFGGSHFFFELGLAVSSLPRKFYWVTANFSCKLNDIWQCCSL